MSNTRKRLIYVLKILKRETNVDHPLNATEIITRLDSYGIKADRRAIYEDINTLIDCGYDISTFEENRVGYYLRETDFEFSELRLLTDAVLSARFISKSQSKELADKIKGLTNQYDEVRLDRVSYLNKRIKCDNASIFYNIDLLTEAIERSRQVSFFYYTYTFSRTLEKKDDRRRYISPYDILWMNDYYYLVGRYSHLQSLTHFRLDKIGDLRIEETPALPISQLPEYAHGLDIAQYANQHAYMFGGKEERIQIKCKNEIFQAMQEKFGEDMHIQQLDDGYFLATITAARRGTLYLVLQFADCVQIVYPEDFREEVRQTLQRMSALYESASK